jgi:DNA-binding sugar fermentation-stimulating protein
LFVLILYNNKKLWKQEFMKYNNINEGIFISRPNRFIAYCEVDGKKETCHVKNTGRCKELLVPGVKVLLEKYNNKRKDIKLPILCEASVQKDSCYCPACGMSMLSSVKNALVAGEIKECENCKKLLYIKQ